MFSFDLLFEIQVPKPWDDRKERDKFHEAIEQSVFAEQMGFECVWFVEHHFLVEFAHSSAPEVLLGAVSQRTSRIRIGHGVTLLPKAVNHPIRVAERAAVIDLVSDGRLEMGTGRSGSPYQLDAFETEVATTREQWEESIRLLPRLWSGEQFSYHGQFFEWDDEIVVVPRPLQRPHPPLWVAATQSDTSQRVGEMGIGVLMTAINAPDALRERIQAYKDAVADPIDPVGPIVNDQCALFTLAFAHDDDEAARVLGGNAAMWYLDTIKKIYANDWRGKSLDQIPDSYRFHVEARRKGMSTGGTFVAQVPEDQGRQAIIDQFVDSGAFCIGDADRVTANVKKYIEVGGDRLVSVMQLADIRHDDVMRSMELFGTSVIPAIRAFEAERDSLVAGAPASSSSH